MDPCHITVHYPPGSNEYYVTLELSSLRDRAAGDACGPLGRKVRPSSTERGPTKTQRMGSLKTARTSHLSGGRRPTVVGHVLHGGA